VQVLFITPYLPDSLRTRSFNFLKQLSERHDITLLSPVFSLEEERHAQQLLIDLPGLKIKTVSFSKIKSLGWSLRAGIARQSMQAFYCYSPAIIHAAKKILIEGEFQIIHIEHFRAAYFGQELQFAGVPIVYDAVDSISLLVERTMRHGPLKQRLVSRLELEATRRYEATLISGDYFEQVCATSREDAAALEKLAVVKPYARFGGRADGTKIKIIPNGVNIFEFTPPPPGAAREPATVIFTGKMSYHSNAAAARYLVKEIWPRVRLAHQGAKLWIVGSRPPKDLMAYSGRHGIEVTGYVPDLAQYLKRASVAVAPLVYSVGIQNKVLEALACATPTIASSQVNRSINVKSGQEIFLTPDREPVAFARQILDLFDNPDRAASVGRAGREFVMREHTWPLASRQLEELWEAALISPEQFARAAS
jgi:glycosyltransferase involved in cell wall biosynthesis